MQRRRKSLRVGGRENAGSPSAAVLGPSGPLFTYAGGLMNAFPGLLCVMHCRYARPVITTESVSRGIRTRIETETRCGRNSSRPLRTRADMGEFRRLCYAELLCFWARRRHPTREAEGVRFELTRPFGLPVFKTGAINRSATPPGISEK
jgi:hypothetical protein